MAYVTDAILEHLSDKGIEAVIPPRSHRVYITTAARCDAPPGNDLDWRPRAPIFFATPGHSDHIDFG